MDEVKPAVRLPTVEHREPYESRGSRTVLGAPGGEIPPGDSPNFHSGHGAQFRFYLPLSAADGAPFEVNGMAVKRLRRLACRHVVFMGIAPK